MTELELHWLAGLLEGEGSFTIKDRHRPAIELEMADEWAVSRAATLMNTTYRQRPVRIGREHHKRTWRTQACGQKCRALLPRLQPLMGPRRAERIQDLLDAERR